MSALRRRNPAGGPGFGSDYQNAMAQLYGKRTARRPVVKASRRLPADWRNRLPDPATYYAAHVEKLGRPNAEGWAQGRCPFHSDHTASLSVHVVGERGLWRCFACGLHGDLTSFHERLTGLDFVGAVRDLIGLGVRS